MNTYERIFKVMIGLLPIYVGIKLLYIVIKLNKEMTIPKDLPFIGFMAAQMLFLLGMLVIFFAFEDKLKR